jgi:hypothetical protein
MMIPTRRTLGIAGAAFLFAIALSCRNRTGSDGRDGASSSSSSGGSELDAGAFDKAALLRAFGECAFGTYKGKHLSVPFVATVDYVLDDRVFLAAMGDGLLERAATGAAAAQPAVLAIDVLPRGLPVDVWQWLFTQAQLPAPARLAQRLQAWNDIHLGAHLDHDRLVIEAQGNRR